MKRGKDIWFAGAALVALVVFAFVFGWTTPFDTVRDGFVARSVGTGEHHAVLGDPVRAVP